MGLKVGRQDRVPRRMKKASAPQHARAVRADAMQEQHPPAPRTPAREPPSNEAAGGALKGDRFGVQRRRWGGDDGPRGTREHATWEAHRDERDQAQSRMTPTYHFAGSNTRIARQSGHPLTPNGPGRTIDRREG